MNIGIASDNDRFSLSIDEAFEQMTQLIQLAVDPEGLSIESYEVVDSYCPGSYDIVINGKKVGGIAQRRFKTGLTTAAYLGVNGDQGARGEAIREFYRIGDGDDSYPTVNPDSMTTLSALTGQDLTVDDIIQRINSIVDDYSTWEVLPFDRSDLQEAYQPMLTKTQQKSATVQPENIDPAS